MAAYTESTPVSALPGVGEKKVKQLEKLGIRTLSDLLYFFPRAYENRGDVLPLSRFDPDRETAHIVTVATQPKSARLRQGLTLTKFRVFDESGSAEVTFFNAAYVKDVFHTGDSFRLYGKGQFARNRLSFVNPKYEPFTPGIPLRDYVPIYPLTEGITSKFIDKLLRGCIDAALPQISDPLPEHIRVQAGLCTLTYALTNIHFPESDTALSGAMRRLAFDEMFLFALGISQASRYKSDTLGVPLSAVDIRPLLQKLPYELTAGQKRAVNDIYADMVSTDRRQKPPMTRILVGDVGSGKTVCAAIAIYIALRNRTQCAFMVPTEILARQHYEYLTSLFSDMDVRVELLLGSTPQKKKREIYAAAAEGGPGVFVGTHALLSDKMNFSDLALVITDEQHRFGVAQRAALKDKSRTAHLLVMSATPIPRTLALAMYGDLDVSKIADMPKGRKKVPTYVVDESYRDRLNAFIRKQCAQGGQCYVVCPAIEPPSPEEAEELIPDGEQGFSLQKQSALPRKSAVEHTAALKAALPDLRIECLHGKMKAEEKNAVMTRFVAGETDVLVSTTVIEVGVNVPRATLMIVENADRFGLSQLHQLRGRVGRGERQSYCVLVSGQQSEKAEQRLQTMHTVYDGFEIAERDLMLRGPGDFFSQNSDDNIRQSGGFTFKMASLCHDVDLMNQAFETARSLFAADPSLTLPEHAALAERLRRTVTVDPSTIS